MKPRKSWEPEYRFGGNKSSCYTPAVLGTTNAYSTPKKPKAARRKGKR